MSEFEASPEFTKLLERPSDIDLVQLMLELAGDAYPALDRVGCLMEIDRLGVACCDQLAVRGATSVREQLEAISHVLYDIEGFHGNRQSYYEPDNSYLNRVLEARQGIPISLGILYMAVAARAGVKMFGVNTPGHFVIGCRDSASTWYVDAFHGGQVLDRKACKRRIEKMVGPGCVTCDDFRPAATVDVVARVLRNLKSAYARANSWCRALGVQRRLAALLPRVAEEQRDLALVYLRVGEPRKALATLEACAAVCPCAQAEILAPGMHAARRMIAELN